MTTFNLPLTSQQARNLLVLIDLAVKAGGLQVASQAVVFQAMITRAAEQADAAAENPSGLQPDGSGPG